MIYEAWQLVFYLISNDNTNEAHLLVYNNDRSTQFKVNFNVELLH